MLPLLSDLLTSSTNSLNANTAASTDGAFLIDGGGGAAAAAAGAAGQPQVAEVAGAVVCALEGMASACVQNSGDPWLYEQALQLLLTMYREPTAVSMFCVGVACWVTDNWGAGRLCVRGRV